MRILSAPTRSLAAASLLFWVQSAFTAPTDIHTEPLSIATSTVKPNIMYILDDSRSMYFQWTPDYVTDWAHTSLYFNCRDSADAGGNLPSTLVNCRAGDVPFAAYEFNVQHYNPNVYYRPGPATDGTDPASRNMNATNTTNWTAVPTDKYGIYNHTTLDRMNANNTDTATVTTVDLVSGYPDRVWCTAKTGATDYTNCVSNADHTYPNATYKYGIDSSNAKKYRYGAPYYYRISSVSYCTDDNMTSCQATEDATHKVRSLIRFCTDSTLSNCQAKRTSTHKYPNFAGTHSTSVAPIAAAKATATIKINDSGSSQSVSVTQVMAGATNLISGTITAGNGTNSDARRNSMASDIANAINARTGTTGYTATVSGRTVTVSAPTGLAYNGTALQVVNLQGSSRASATLTVTKTSSGKKVTLITIGNLDNPDASPATSDVPVVAMPNVLSGFGSDTAANRTAAATAIAAAINNYANASPWEYTATSSGAVVTIYAPVNAGSAPNGLSISVTADSGINTSTTNFSGGSGNGGVPTTTTSFSGGADAVAGVQHWTSPITFERTDIVPYLDPPTNSVAKTFNKGADRDDCVTLGNACTYEEEMTNFANWYAYYRTRMQAVKTATARAFTTVSDAYRVGFITIYPYGFSSSQSSIDTNKYLKIADFAYDSTSGTGHKKDWITKLYSITFNDNGTPLREALSRVGRLYAGKFDGINNGIPAADDPVLYACQPNFAILTTDGYWNQSGGKDLDGNAMTDQDSTDSGYSTKASGAWDGNAASNTLADVAMYYYKNDLRTSMADNVFTTAKDTAAHQHMTTFTIGLGLAGELNYDPNYESQSSSNPGDFYSIKQGTKKWPVPVGDTETALDDLWHAAVNGRGTFYSASDPKQFANGLNETLRSLLARGGAGAAAATSNLQPIAGDQFAFTAEYQTADWIGDLKARTIDLNTGVVSTAEPPLWSARSLLDARNYTDRVIYTFDSTDTAVTPTPGSGNRLKHFCYTSGSTNCTDGGGLTTGVGGEQSYFDPSSLTQASSWVANQLTSASGANLVDYLRGDRSNETTGGTDVTDLYRSRLGVLGDIINAQPVYVKRPLFNYDTGSDPYYQTFKTNNASRLGTVFSAANDGMLHAFETDVNNDPYYQTAGINTTTLSDDTYTGNNANNGKERWAFIPTMVLPKLKKLADTNYAHDYFVDGSPVVGDVCQDHTLTTKCSDATKWKTILVGGLGAGGRGYYALDITDPSAPKGLWEFKSSTTCLSSVQVQTGTYDADCNVGLSFGNPIIAKRPTDGRWVVIVTSGYNNYNPGDGKGYLYVLDAITGKILERITTGVGSGGTSPSYTDANPSGLAKINAWATNANEDNTAQAVYGGDLLGNVWRFDLTLTPSSPGYGTAYKLATLTDTETPANPQPITVKPELGEASGYRVVLLGTGKLLGLTDKSDYSQQTIYALRDDMTDTAAISGRSDMLPRSLVAGTVANTRTTTAATAMDWYTYKGWYIDLPDRKTTGTAAERYAERVNVDPQLQLGTFIVASNVPSQNTCTTGGYGWMNFFNFRTGEYVSGSADKIASTKISSAVIVGFNTIKLGSTVKNIVTTADNQRLTGDTPAATTAVGGKRVSWREIVNED